MFNSKYSNVLTVILVIVIITIIGLLIFWGIDVYNKYYITKEASDAVSKFENEIKNTTTNNIVNDTTNETDNETIIDQNLINGLNTNTSSGNNNSNNVDNKKYYKGFVMKGTIKIPKTGLECPILENAGKKAIEVAVGIQYPTEADLNQKGNVIIAGHNYRNGMFFSNNKKLENGDKIYITDLTGQTLEYTIYNKYETTPEDASYMIRDIGDNIEISLTTCTDDNSKRLIIWAKAN